MSDLAPPPDPGRDICALVLAGGAGRRSGGRDKGLLYWCGKMLVEHVIERIRPQADELLISCNRNREVYRRFATLTAPDQRADYQGPLAGLEAARESIHGEFLLLVPCDTPMLPSDLGARLLTPLAQDPDCQVSYAHTADSGHYLCAMLRTTCLHSLPAYLDSGQRAVHRWYRELGAVPVDFDDQRECFLNINKLLSAET